MNPYRELREERGLTITEVAEATGIDRGTIGNLELGNTGQPSVPVAKALADYYGLSVAQFRALAQTEAAA